MTTPFNAIWIIGASTGIGRATALAFTRLGVTVFASARTREALLSLAQEAPEGLIQPMPLDARNREDVHACYEEIKARYGAAPGAILYAAATWSPVQSSQTALAILEPVFEVNVYGCLHVLEAILPDFKARGSGHVGIISSVAGFRGLPRALAYGASKAALTHIAEALKFECDPVGVTVHVIHPGFVKTPLTDKNDFPMPCLMTAEEAAKCIIRGMRGQGFEITFPRRFTYLLKLLRILPYKLYFALVRWGTKGIGSG